MAIRGGFAPALADKLGADAIDRSAHSRDELMETPGIENTLKEAVACEVAVVGILGILPSSAMIQGGFFSSEEFLKLAGRGVVGDVCFQFLDMEEAICLPESSARVVGITQNN